MKEDVDTLQNDINNATRKREAYSLHTMTFNARLTVIETRLIREKLISYQKNGKCRYSPDTVKEGSATITFWGFQTIPFNYIKIKTAEIVNGKFCYMSFKINPRRMFHKNNHPFVYIADSEDIRKSLVSIQLFLNEVGITEISAEAFYLQRLDYCTNIRIGSKERVVEYMRLMRKGMCPHPTHRRLEYSLTQRREIPTKNSFTATCDSYEFSVYDKQSQMDGEADKYGAEEVEEAEGIIQIELRMSRRKIKYEMDKRLYCDDEEFLLHTSECSEELLNRCLKSCFGTGGFVMYEKAVELVKDRGYKKKTKKRMLDLLSFVAHSSLDDAKERYRRMYGDEYGPYRFRDLMGKFNELEISSITIRNRAEFEWFENPLEYIRSNNANYE